MEPNTTREKLLSHAQTLIGERGCNGFSYRDLAEHVGVKTSSIHYYFPNKEDLLLEAVDAYANRIWNHVESIDPRLPANARLDRYVSMLEGALARKNSDAVCVCGMMAADLSSLPESVAAALQAFFRRHEAWLVRLLSDGQQDGTLRFQGDDAQTAGRVLYAAIQGSALTSRLFKTPSRLREVVSCYYAKPPESS